MIDTTLTDAQVKVLWSAWLLGASLADPEAPALLERGYLERETLAGVETLQLTYKGREQVRARQEAAAAK